MEKKLKRWSEDEISRLRQIMTKYTSDREGCIYASIELGRPYGGVRSKWDKIKPNKQRYGKKVEYVDILRKNLSKYPGNLTNAFKVTAEETGKSSNYFRTQYYCFKDSPLYRGNISTCFTMISKDRRASNAKNYDSTKMPKSTKQKVKQLIANLFGIKKEDL